MKNRAGSTVRNLSGEMAYDSFYPQPLPPQPEIGIDSEMRQLLIDAHKNLGLLNGLTDRIPNKDLFLSMYVRKEALVSSQIEGTQCTLEDVLDPEIDENINADVSDVVNYVRAINFAIQRMKELPFCCRLIRETHAVLMNSVRGSDKTPGEFRTSQNWIGGAGSSLRNARYIPPNPQDMIEAMSDLEKYMNTDDTLDPLIRAALIHYQFETIHPFLDGNGRLGRLLITLSLMNDHALSAAVFYPSYQLKLRRSEYYEHLMAVRENGEYAKWVGFFCDCLLTSAENAVGSLERLVNLHNANTALINESLGRSATNGQRLLELLEGNPIVDVAFVVEKLDIARTTASNLVKDFVDLGMLVQREKEKQRYRTFLYEDYLGILRQGSDPL